ncbi:tetraacyldisaccharide 4'-kinase [Cerasicoccus maritimus]|uniref:tetraacyldisaccharide 4'-kinase n=1 Tax=Cerasicoccus maritimus TaxID=490089 RepID=UPI0028527C44|nr:tetraacyldisaccharide 4'-kinase [Cerasicoccus maritimus]
MDLTFKERWKHRMERLEEFMIDVAFDRRHGRVETLVAGLLRGLSMIFSGIAQTRFFLYRKRVLRDQPLGCLVVVVGNLTVGGTGKTPVVEKFARSLNERGRKVAILSRGYGSKKEPGYKRFMRWITHRQAPPPKIVSDGKTVMLDSHVAGDEPYMLARNCPGVVVLVDKNRVKAGEYAIRHFGADTLLLDDGFQYLPLRGMINLLLVDKNNPFGNQNLLPRGILREPVKHLQRASYIFLTKSDGVPDPELEDLIHQHKPDAELIECTHQPKYIQTVFGDEQNPLEWLRGKRVAAFSGIATPESFEAFLTRLGATIVFNRRFLDHHRFTAWEIEQYFDEANEAQVDLVITTEKDAVRVKEDWVPAQAPFYFLRLEVEILRGVKDFDEAVSRICFPKRTVHTGTRSPFAQGKKTG